MPRLCAAYLHQSHSQQDFALTYCQLYFFLPDIQRNRVKQDDNHIIVIKTCGDTSIQRILLLYNLLGDFLSVCFTLTRLQTFQYNRDPNLRVIRGCL